MDPAKELLQQAIDRAEYMYDHLTMAPISMSKALMEEVLKDLKAGFVAVTGENPWK